MKKAFLSLMVLALAGVAGSCGEKDNSGLQNNKKNVAGDGATQGDSGKGDDERQKADLTKSEACLAEAEKMPADKKIINGQGDATLYDISAGEKKAIVALLGYSENIEEWYNQCTVTVITPHLLITAAHCFVEGGQDEVVVGDFKIAIGEDVDYANVSTEKLEQYYGTKVFSPKEILVNPKYAGEAADDHAIIIMDEDMTRAVPGLVPIPLNSSTMTQDGFYGKYVQNVGYGATSVAYLDYPDEYEPADDDEEYLAAYYAYYNTKRWWTTEPIEEVSGNYFSVYGNEVSSVCFGDSGGPALFRDDEGRLKILGTVSNGDESCTGHDYYTRVDSDMWIYMAAGDLLYEEPAPLTAEEQFCQDAGWAGICEGQVAKWCQDGHVFTRDCTKCGQTCQDTATLGAYCR